MTTLWAVTIDLFSWERENYEMFIQNCAVLTNMHIRFLPLRDLDSREYSQYLNRLLSSGKKRVDKDSATTQKYPKKRKQRIDVIVFSLEDAFRDNDDDFGGNLTNNSIFRLSP
ncbi:hypothetical protein Ae201684P_010585 [Aphanomyces euteiches]|uniref:Uncharacterized protein n=1 Tax=Aphanomyces euteiches TaxID=100861 RepID=A0A6G0WB29_9STRA|nr:hypothetical protein Ae201684_016845 [Aphanomyces euteiches]KAH9076645.1 hypothetical protein Ae201684P_010585 [Aphanomyces euteiches]